MQNSNKNNNFKKGWVMEGVPTEKQRREEKRQIKEGKNAEMANNPYGIADYGANDGQQYDQQYGQANAAGDNYYQENATNGAVWYNDAAASHSASYNYQVDPPVVTDTFAQYANANYPGGSNYYQDGSQYYHNRTDENYRTDVATDGMVEIINGKQKKKEWKA